MKNEENTTTKEDCQGIQFPGSLRDWFAGMAMQGYIANPTSFGPPVPESDKGNVELIAGICALFAYEVADAMIARRKR